MKSLKLPQRNQRGHKGTFGTVLVIGGADGKLSMLGGPVLAALAAYRIGAGKVVVAVPGSLVHSALELLPESLVFDYNNDKILASEAKNATSVVIGPGWGYGESQVRVLKNILSLHKPTVIDADALNIICKDEDVASFVHNLCILTPHPGEFNRLSEALKVQSPRQLAQKLGAVVVYKDSTTVITDGKQDYEHDRPNSRLAIAGSGDVLSGIIGGLQAQFSNEISPFDIAKLGVNIHSNAGDRLKAGGLAHELADVINMVE